MVAGRTAIVSALLPSLQPTTNMNQIVAVSLVVIVSIVACSPLQFSPDTTKGSQHATQ
jgi:hypothetical protein